MVTWGGGGGWRCFFSRVTQVKMVASGLIGAFQSAENWSKLVEIDAKVDSWLRSVCFAQTHC